MRKSHYSTSILLYIASSAGIPSIRILYITNQEKSISLILKKHCCSDALNAVMSVEMK